MVANRRSQNLFSMIEIVPTVGIVHLTLPRYLGAPYHETPSELGSMPGAEDV
jgi:hypothetical protein